MGLLGRVVLIVALALLPALGLEVYDQRALRHAQRAQLHDEAVRQARSVADELGRILDGTREALLALAMTQPITASDRPACQALLAGFRARLPFLRVLALVGGDDRVVCNSVPGAPLGEVATSWVHVRAARQRDGFAAAGFLLGAWVREPLLATAMPLDHPPGAPGQAAAPVLIADIDLTWLAAQLRMLAAQGGAHVTVVDRRGKVLVAVPDGPAPGSAAPAEAAGWLARTEPGAEPEPPGRGRDRMVGVAPLPDLVVAVRLDQSKAAAAQDGAARRSILVSGVALLAALFVAMLIAQRTIAGPVERIVRTIARWREGDLAARVAPAETGSEFGRIGAALDELLAMVARTETDLRRAKSELEARVAERTERLGAEVQEREAVQAQLLQAQKMEVVGQLTGGVAHDFNNLLTAVIGNLELALLRSRDRPEVERLLGGAMRAAERGAALTQRMLAFGRRQYLRLQPVDVAALLDGMQDLLARTIGPTVRIDIAVAPGLWPARADPNQVELVLLNLAINARDAMPGGGTLRLSAEAERVAEGALHPVPLAPGDYVRLRLRDEGAGIAPALLARVLEPFFTTKAAGKGSGLGLSMAQGVAVQSGGGLAIESVLGQGTTVSVWLPRDHAPVAAASPAAEPPPPPSVARPGPAPSILLVDDDAEVAEVAQQLLRDEGFAVVRADQAAGALALLDEGVPVDLLIADVAMPGVNGLQLADLARARRPGLRVLLATGYAQDGQAMGRNPGFPVLRKPFRAEQLVTAVRRLLEPEAADPG